MRLTAFLSVAASSMLVACAAGSSSTSEADVKAIGAAIDSMDAKMQVWLARDMIDSIVSGYYASDAVVMNPNSPALKGSDALRAAWGDMIKTMGLRLTLTRSALIVSDSIASSQGQFQIRILGKPDTTQVLMSDHGNYLTTWVKRNGQWRALYDIATSEVPLPPPPAAPTKGKAK